jgi:hypothetical protein
VTDAQQHPAEHRPVSRDTLVELYSAQARDLGDQIVSLIPSMENFIGVVVAIVVGTATLGLTQKHHTLLHVLLALLPFPLIVLTTYLLQANTELLSRAGHKRFLEEKVNELLGSRVLLEESDVAPATLQGRYPVGRFSVALIQLFLGTLVVGGCVLGVINYHYIHGTGWRAVYWVYFVVGLVILVGAIREQMRAAEGGYQAARRGFDGAPPPSSGLFATWRTWSSRTPGNTRKE